MVIEKKYITTSQFAEIVGIKPDTIRRGLCIRGHYMNVVPKKLENRHLRWPVREVEKILGDEGAR